MNFSARMGIRSGDIDMAGISSKLEKVTEDSSLLSGKARPDLFTFSPSSLRVYDEDLNSALRARGHPGMNTDRLAVSGRASKRSGVSPCVASNLLYNISSAFLICMVVFCIFRPYCSESTRPQHAQSGKQRPETRRLGRSSSGIFRANRGGFRGEGCFFESSEYCSEFSTFRPCCR